MKVLERESMSIVEGGRRSDFEYDKAYTRNVDPSHIMRTRSGGYMECALCGMRAHWPGARMPCTGKGCRNVSTRNAMEVRALVAQGVKPAAVAKRLGLSPRSVYRILATNPDKAERPRAQHLIKIEQCLSDGEMWTVRKLAHHTGYSEQTIGNGLRLLELEQYAEKIGKLKGGRVLWQTAVKSSH